MSKRVLITGATGFIGRELCRELSNAGYDVLALSRNPEKAKTLLAPDVNVVQWDARTTGPWADMVSGALAIVNLAGETIAALRWTAKKKQQILQSRLNLTNTVAQAVQKAKQKPELVIQASGIGFYGDRGDEILDENSSNGTGFLADVAKQWEGAIQPVEALGVRCVRIRIAVVAGPRGGFMARVLPAFRLFVGGHPGTGRQWLSWIHLDDVAGAIRFLIENRQLNGAVNLTAPNPLPSKDFYNLLGKQMHRPAFFPMPSFFLKLVMGQMACELLLSGQRTLPGKLLKAGYEFKYPYAASALRSLFTTNTHP